MKVKLVAIAKDEAAYLPYWIFHHLHFGFDAIEIHINRCQDNSSALLDKIVSLHPEVSYRSADWVDIAPNNVSQLIQYAVYAESYCRIKAEAKFSHICFLDIDEFWTPRNFTSTILQCLLELPEASTVSFNWLNVLKEEKPFAHLTQKLCVQPAPTVKSVINFKADVCRIQQHLPEFVDNENFSGHILSDGRKFKHSSKERQRLADSEKTIKFPYFVLHRMYRTEMEYVALLSRGRPRNNAPFKMNRPGYLTSDVNQQELIIADDLYQDYCINYERFLKRLNIAEEINLAKELTYKRFDNTVALLQKGPTHFDSEQWTGIKKIFSGVNDTNIIKALAAFEQLSSVDNPFKKLIKPFLRR